MRACPPWRKNHYYAFGLRISGISSHKFDGGLEGSLKNDFLYNDKELWDDADLNWYDYGFRNYDAQISRFTQLDPLTWDYPELTNYQYASNEPIANVDMDGLEALKSILNPGTWFNLPQMMDEIVITAAAKAGSAMGSVAGSVASLFGMGVQQLARGVDNTFVRQPLPTVENNDGILSSVIKNVPRALSGQQVMEPLNWFDKVMDGSYREQKINDGFGNMISLQVDNQGYLTNKAGLNLIYNEMTPPDKAPFKLLKYGAKIAKGGKAVKGATNLIPQGKLANHLFKGAGKLADNPANRMLIQKIANGKPLVVDKFGKSWYRGVDAAGNGVYSYTQNGIVKGAGYTNFNNEQLINHIIKTVGIK